MDEKYLLLVSHLLRGNDANFPAKSLVQKSLHLFSPWRSGDPFTRHGTGQLHLGCDVASNYSMFPPPLPRTCCTFTREATWPVAMWVVTVGPSTGWVCLEPLARPLTQARMIDSGGVCTGGDHVPSSHSAVRAMCCAMCSTVLSGFGV